MNSYTVRFRVTAYREVEIDAPSPDAAALVALGWKSSGSVAVDGAQIDQGNPDVRVWDEDRRVELVRMPSPDEGPIHLDIENAEEVEGASDDERTTRRR